MTEQIPSAQWGIVELMGHKVVAGRISKDEMLGKPMLRVDVPATASFGEFTQFYGESALYCVTFTSEEVAQRTAEQCRVNPVSVYVPDLVTREQLEQLKRRQLPAGSNDDDSNDPDED